MTQAKFDPQRIREVFNQLKERLKEPIDPRFGVITLPSIVHPYIPGLSYSFPKIIATREPFETKIQIWFPPEWTRRIPWFGNWLRRRYYENEKNWRLYISGKILETPEALICHPVTAAKLRSAIQVRYS